VRKIILISLSALLMISVVVFGQEVKSSGAKLFIDQTSFDFGYIAGGEVASHSFFFLSKGTDSLKILKVQPG
jgi:hypothetical protein